MSTRTDALNRFVGPNKDSPHWKGLLSWYPIIRGDAMDFGSRQNNRAVADSTASTSIHSELGVTGEFTQTATDRYRVTGFTGLLDFPYSISCWLVSNAPAGSFEGIFTIGAASNQQIAIDVRSSNLEAVSQSGGSSSFNGGTAISAGDLHHAVFVLENATSRKFYVDGALISTATANQAYFTPDRLELGDLIYESLPFDGKLADARVYSRRLAIADVQHMYDPATRWDLYKTRRGFPPFGAQPSTGGGIIGTSIGSLLVGQHPMM